MNFSASASFIFFFFLPGEDLHVFSLCTSSLIMCFWPYFLALIDVVQSDGNSWKGFLQRERSDGLWPVWNATAWDVCVGESVCHRTNTEKVGRGGRKREEECNRVLTLFSNLLSLFVQFSTCRKERRWQNTFFFSFLLMLNLALSIYTFSASSNPKWDRLFPCAPPCVYLAMFPTVQVVCKK